MNSVRPRTQAPVLLRAVASIGVLALVWLLRPNLARLPRSLAAPLTVSGVEHLAGFIAWCTVALVALASTIGAIRKSWGKHGPSQTVPVRPRGGRLRSARSTERPSRTGPRPTLLVTRGSRSPVAASPGHDPAPGLTAEQPADRPPRAMNGRVTIALLGPFVLRGVALGRGLSSATEHLLAYLALRPEGATRDELLEALWPDQDPRRTRPRLWQSVTQARKVLGDGAFVRDRDRYRIDFNVVDLDLRELDRLIADAERAEQPADQRRLLEQALSLVRGRPLTDVDLPWASEAARRLTSTIATLLERAGRARLADGEPRLAIDAAEQGLAVDGLNESLWRLAMEAEAALDLRESVARRYEKLCQSLDDHLGLEPSRETRALYRALLAQG